MLKLSYNVCNQEKITIRLRIHNFPKLLLILLFPPNSHLSCVCVWGCLCVCVSQSVCLKVPCHVSWRLFWWPVTFCSNFFNLLAFPFPLWLYFSAVQLCCPLTPKCDAEDKQKTEEGVGGSLILVAEDYNVILYRSLLENSLSACPLPQQHPCSCEGSSVVLKGT